MFQIEEYVRMKGEILMPAFSSDHGLEDHMEQAGVH